MCEDRYHIRIAPNAVGTFSTPNPSPRTIEILKEVVRLAMAQEECNDIMWWGYLHANGTIQVKRWLGDPKDYTEDCEGNDLVQLVVRPFVAKSQEEAYEFIKSHVT